MAPSYNAKTTSEEIAQDLASQIKGKVILTTGVSPASIGATFVKSIAAANPSLLILAGRNTAKIQETADAIASANPNVKVRLLELDLGSLAAVRKSAALVNAWADVPVIDVLVNNAGIMATDFALTADGFERQFATNHLAHFLFTNLVMDKILASEAPRVVSVSSDAYMLSPIRFDDVDFKKGETYNKWQAYGQSKTGNVLLALQLARTLGPKRGLRAYSLHPGIIAGTTLADHLDWAVESETLRIVKESVGLPVDKLDPEKFVFKTPSQGAATHVFAAFADEALREHNGAYLVDAHVPDPNDKTVFQPWATSGEDAEKLWKLSEELVGQEFAY
ncbi:hypothetical protein B0T19DRAFT_376274 [Cercophora scortea]|uniref:Short-chain dehydrogenase n=1 Tax=Cercophora scortea TaxID=314031 RepID=A0AAE0I2N5_9PEZI|nr:hypothetical protein B0T19DRAFT_376274 [Cercophora scortea]